MGAKGYEMADYYDALQLRAELITRNAGTSGRFDAVVMPTLPLIAPPISKFLATEEGRKDGFPILIRNTCIANYLDRCAVTVPCNAPGEAPAGFTVMGDRRVIEFGKAIEAAL